MRCLISFAGGLGHFLPMLPLIIEMRKHGHQIVIACQSEMLREITSRGFEAVDAGGSTFQDPGLRSRLHAVNMAREERVVRRSFAGRVARERAERITGIIGVFSPDLILCDEMDFGAMLAAEKAGIAQATVLVIASGGLARADVIGQPIAALRAEMGLAPDADVRWPGRKLTLSPFPKALRDPSMPMSEPIVFFRGHDVLPAAKTCDRPHLYVTLGTVFNVESGDLFRRLLDGIAIADISATLTIGPQMDVSELGMIPPGVTVERFVDQNMVLPQCDLVICHGGSGTVLAALAHGLPLILVPMGADQPLTAARCEALGVARVLDVIDVTAGDIARAIEDVLGNRAMREAALRLSQDISAMGNVPSALSAFLHV